MCEYVSLIVDSFLCDFDVLLTTSIFYFFFYTQCVCIHYYRVDGTRSSCFGILRVATLFFVATFVACDFLQVSDCCRDSSLCRFVPIPIFAFVVSNMSDWCCSRFQCLFLRVFELDDFESSLSVSNKSCV